MGLLRNKKTESASADPMVLAVDHAVKRGLRIPKWIMYLVLFLVVLSVVANIVLAVFIDKTNVNASQLKQDAVSQCEAGNAFRANQLNVWEKNYALQAQLQANQNKSTAPLLQQLLQQLANGDPAKLKQIEAIVTANNKASQDEVQTFLNYVKSVTLPRDCAAQFSNVKGNGAATGSGDPPPPAKTAAYTSAPALVYLLSWDGACMTIANANVGTRISMSPCSSAHAWWYYPDGQLSPSGHPDVAAGDSGGYLELKSAPSSPVYGDGSKVGPGGFIYNQLWFGVPGTYFHADGSGQYVTLDNQPGDLANFWAFTVLGQSPLRGTV